MALGDVELGRLQQILTLSDDGAEGGQGESSCPVMSGLGFRARV